MIPPNIPKKNVPEFGKLDSTAKTHLEEINKGLKSGDKAKVQENVEGLINATKSDSIAREKALGKLGLNLKKDANPTADSIVKMLFDKQKYTNIIDKLPGH